MARTAIEAVNDAIGLYNDWVEKSAIDAGDDDQAAWLADFDGFNTGLSIILASVPSTDGHPNGHPTHPPKE